MKYTASVILAILVSVTLPAPTAELLKRQFGVGCYVSCTQQSQDFLPPQPGAFDLFTWPSYYCDTFTVESFVTCLENTCPPMDLSSIQTFASGTCRSNPFDNGETVEDAEGSAPPQVTLTVDQISEAEAPQETSI